MKFVEPSANIIYNINDTIGIKLLTSTVWKVSVFQVFLVRIFPKFGLKTEQENSEYEHFLRSAGTKIQTRFQRQIEAILLL